MSPILSQLSEFSSTLLTHSFQVLLCSSLFPMGSFLYMPSEQCFFIKFFATYITPVRLSNRMRLHMGIPIFLPTITLITKLALERLHTKMFVHVLAKISSFKETFFTLSTMIASNLRLWLMFLQVLAESRAPVKRLSTN